MSKRLKNHASFWRIVFCGWKVQSGGCNKRMYVCMCARANLNRPVFRSRKQWNILIYLYKPDMEDNFTARGTSSKFLVECEARTLKPVSYFRPKCTIFHSLFQTWAKNRVKTSKISSLLLYVTAANQTWLPLCEHLPMLMRKKHPMPSQSEKQTLLQIKMVKTYTFLTCKIQVVGIVGRLNRSSLRSFASCYTFSKFA